MRRARCAVAVAAWGALASAVCGAPLTVSLPATADAFVAAAAPGNNFGAAGALVIAAPTPSTGELQGLLRFDAAPARAELDAHFGPGQWSLAGATLRLQTTAPSNPLFPPLAAGVLRAAWLAGDDWVEGSGSPRSASTVGLTFNNLPSALSPADQPLGTASYDGGLGSYDFPLATSPGMAADLSAGGLVTLLLAPGDAGVSLVAQARDNPSAVERPQLLLTAVPEPAGLTLAATAIALLAARARRRQP